MAWHRSKPSKGIVPVRAMLLCWTFITAIMLGVGATVSQQTKRSSDLYGWLAVPALLLGIILMLALYGAITRPRLVAEVARQGPVRRRETTYGRR